MFDQQMRPEETRYPVDRYLVESSKKNDMINIIDDDIWNSEPALRPEDEIILRKLHDMLQSTADDLKLLSGELSKYHGLRVQKKTLPMPLDEEFNEKVHIEEVVNAKFHGQNIIETECTPNRIHKNVIDGIIQSIASKGKTKQLVNHGVQVNQVPVHRKSIIKSNLGVSRTNVIQIDENPSKNITLHNTFINSQKKNTNTYKEFCYKSFAESKPSSVIKSLQIQEMPSINIRSELKEQKVLQIDINPESKDVCENKFINHNALVIEMKHEDIPKTISQKSFTFDHVQLHATSDKPTTRKVSKMTAYESSSANNVSSGSQDNQRKQKIKNTITLRSTQRRHLPNGQKARINIFSKRDQDIKRDGKLSLDEWQKKLKTVYGDTSKLRNSGVKVVKVSPKKTNKQKSTSRNKITAKTDNTEYIPYSKLTIGGVNVSDIEREICSLPNRGDIVLSPILDKILSSRENSFHKDTPRKNKSSKILTTSDENLLQDVLNIEKEISRSISAKNDNNIKKISENSQMTTNYSYRNGDSYDDDFEVEKSDGSNKTQISNLESLDSKASNDSKPDDSNDIPEIERNQPDNSKIHNDTFKKMSNLSFKNTVDIFEFIHSVDTQETGTQSNTSTKRTIQETQTSSSEDKANIEPIHNNLWPSSIDPDGEVQTMFKLEKEFIKKLIIDEYGDLIEKQFNKPSTSKNIDNDNTDRNVSSSQKNTQTSPAHVKSVMTSPTRTKTRTTSPFALSLSVNQQTSPIFVLSKEEELKVEIENDEDLGISVNLSSPRFSLRLPQTSREVISNFKSGLSNKIEPLKPSNIQKNILCSSSSVDGDYSSSDISSLGEIHKMYKKRLRKSRIASISEISSSSSSVSRNSKYSSDFSDAIRPLKSEGEASIIYSKAKKTNRKLSNKISKSEGEMSFGQL